MRRGQPIAERPINERVALRVISRRLETSRPDETNGRDPVDLTRRMAELDHIWRLPEDELSRPRNEEKAEANAASPNKTLYIIKIIIGSLKFILIVKTTISYYSYITGELQRQPIAKQSRRIIRSLTRELLFYVIKTYRNSRVAINYYFLLLNASTRKAQRRTAGKLTIIFTSIKQVARCLAGGPSEQKRRVDTSACYYTALLLFYYWLLFYYFYYFYYTTRPPIDGRGTRETALTYYYANGASTRYREPRELGGVEFRIRAPDASGERYYTSNGDRTDTRDADESTELYFYFVHVQDLFYLSEHEKPNATAKLFISIYGSLRLEGEPMCCIQLAPRKRSNDKIERLNLFSNYYQEAQASVEGRNYSARVPRYLYNMYICKLVRVTCESNCTKEWMNVRKAKARVTGRVRGGRRQAAAGLAERPVVGMTPAGYYKTSAQRPRRVFRIERYLT